MSRIDFVQSALEGSVLDVGHAVGPLHGIVSKGRSVAAIDIAIKKPEKGVVKADAMRMPFKGRAFGSVLAGELIEHMEKPGSFLEESRRVLKKGGLLVITTPNRKSLLNRMFRAYEKPAHLSLFSKEELFSLLKEHGFRVEKCNLFPYTVESSEGSRHKWFYPVRKALHPFLPNSLREQIAVAARMV